MASTQVATTSSPHLLLEGSRAASMVNDGSIAACVCSKVRGDQADAARLAE